MKNKKILTIIVLVIVVITTLIIYTLTNNNFYKTAIDNIKYNYNNTLNKDINLPKLSNDEYIINGNLKSEFTSNLVHSANQVFEKNNNFKIKEGNDKLNIYLDDKYAEINLKEVINLIDINTLDTCKYVDKTKEEDMTKHNYSCGNYNLSIYTKLNKYVKSKITYDDVVIEIANDKVAYKNNNITLEYSNIKEDNYVLEVEYNNKKFKVFYSYNEYSKYSFVFDSLKFNIIIDKDIVLSMNCNTKSYSNLKLTITKDKKEESNDYKKVELDEILSSIFTEEIYSLIK